MAVPGEEASAAGPPRRRWDAAAPLTNISASLNITPCATPSATLSAPPSATTTAAAAGAAAAPPAAEMQSARLSERNEALKARLAALGRH